MRLPDDNKRRQILAAAADMFANQQYHKVRLDDVATAAGVGKGTLYVYFESKEDLYFTIIYESLASLTTRLREQLSTDHSGAMHRIRTVVDALVDHAFQHPQFFELVKTIGIVSSKWDSYREEMFNMIEQTIREGISSGELREMNPSLYARFIPGLVRSAMFFGSKDLQPADLKQQICGMLEHGVVSATHAPISA
jgi:AcrR family transcriptional regulator